MASVLVCDDERSLCQVLEIDLRKEGYKVETVNNREDAKRKIDSALFDVIVTDIRMPNTDDGMEVLAHARRISPDSAVILPLILEQHSASVFGPYSSRIVEMSLSERLRGLKFGIPKTPIFPKLSSIVAPRTLECRRPSRCPIS